MTTNYEKIKNMSLNEVLKLLANTACKQCTHNGYYQNCTSYGCEDGIKHWLNQEVEE